MASFLERLLGRKEPSSAELARERLKLVLVTDRSDLSPEKLKLMQNEIMAVIKRYLQIDDEQVQIKLEQRDRKNYLVADIPLARDHKPYEPTVNEASYSEVTRPVIVPDIPPITPESKSDPNDKS
jgi:cell division topological specificity factor